MRTSMIHFKNGLRGSLLITALLSVTTLQAGTEQNVTPFGTYYGDGAGSSNTTGRSNAFFGRYTGYFNTSGQFNAFFGGNAGHKNISGNFNTFVGYVAGWHNVEGSENTFVGQSAGYNNVEGSDNTFVGQSAGYNNTGSWNAFLGREAGYSNEEGFLNTFVGMSAGYFNMTGGYNTALGVGAGLSNTTESNNSFLGGYSNGVAGITNATAIGWQAAVEQSNSLVLGSTPGVNDLWLPNEYVDVGIGVTAPMAALHVKRVDHSLPAQILVEDTSGTTETRTLLSLMNNGRVNLSLTDTAAGTQYEIGTATANGQFAVLSNGVALMKITDTGRVRFGSGGSPSMDVSNNGNVTIAGTLTELSDVNAKQGISELEGQYVLAKLDSLPVSQWRYKNSPESVHVGPMAQDFHKAFGLGVDDTHISPRDMAGVALAAIKALKLEKDSELKAMEVKHDLAMAEKDAEMAELKAELRQAVEALKVRLEAVESSHPIIQASVQ